MPPPAPGPKSEREAAALVLYLVQENLHLRQAGQRLICWVADQSGGTPIAKDYCQVPAHPQAPAAIVRGARP